MVSLEAMVKAKISQTYLNRAFSIIEILVVIVIIGIASSSFILLFQLPANYVSIKEKINFYKYLSLYSGNVYKFNNSGIYEVNGDDITLIDDKLPFEVQSTAHNNLVNNVSNDQHYFLIIYPGLEMSTNYLTLANGKRVTLIDES